MEILFIEPPAPILKTSDNRLVHQVRKSHPKFTHLLLIGETKKRLQNFGIDCDFSFIDMKMTDQQKKYGEIEYGDQRFQKYRIGAAFDSIQEKIQKATFVCISAKFTQEAQVIADLAKHIKQESPHTSIIIGGGEAELRKHWYLNNGADIVVLGEGEETLANIIIRHALGGDFRESNNIAYRSENRELKINRSRVIHPCRKQIWQATPTIDFSICDINQYQESMGAMPSFVNPPMMYFETTRGCLYACDFCQRSALKKAFSIMPIEMVKEMIDQYAAAGIRTLLFCEENVLLRLLYPNGRQELLEIFKYLKKRGFQWEFSVGIAIGLFMKDGKIDQELLEAVFAGCFRALISLEHLTDQKIQNLAKLKPFEDEKRILEAIAKTKCPKLHIGIMIGDKDESKKSLETILVRCLEIKTIATTHTKIKFSFFCRMPLFGTPDWSRLESSIKYPITDHPELWTVSTSVIQGDSYSPEQITRIRKGLSTFLNGKEDQKAIERSGLIKF